MGQWDNLIADIVALIKENGNEEITGQIMQDVLTSIVSLVGGNPTYGGFADNPSYNPGAHDGPVIYIATQAGTYASFDNAVVNNGITLLSNKSGSWVAQEIVLFADSLGDSETTLMHQKGIKDEFNSRVHFGGYAEPSTTPDTSKGKIMYIATQAGTYTDFDSLVVDDGITILTYDGASWAKQPILSNFVKHSDVVNPDVTEKQLSTEAGEDFYPKSHAQSTYMADGRKVEDAVNAKPDTTALHVQFPTYAPTLPAFAGQQGSTPCVAGMPNLNFVYNDRGTGDGSQMKYWEQVQKSVFTGARFVDMTKIVDYQDVDEITIAVAFKNVSSLEQWIFSYPRENGRNDNLDIKASSSLQKIVLVYIDPVSGYSVIHLSSSLDVSGQIMLSYRQSTKEFKVWYNGVLKGEGVTTVNINEGLFVGKSSREGSFLSDIKILKMWGDNELAQLLYNGGRPWEYQLPKEYYTPFANTYDLTNFVVKDSSTLITLPDSFTTSSDTGFIVWDGVNISEYVVIEFDVIVNGGNGRIQTLNITQSENYPVDLPDGVSVHISQKIKVNNGDRFGVYRWSGYPALTYDISNFSIAQALVTHQYDTSELGVNIWRSNGTTLEAGDLELIQNDGTVLAEVTNEKPFASYGEQSGAPDYASVATNGLVRFDPATGTYYRADGDGGWIALNSTPVI